MSRLLHSPPLLRTYPPSRRLQLGSVRIGVILARTRLKLLRFLELEISARFRADSVRRLILFHEAIEWGVISGTWFRCLLFALWRVVGFGTH